MAHRKMILTEAGAAFYRTRMLSAGDPVMLGANDARLFTKHGWATAEPAKAAKVREIEPKDGYRRYERIEDDLTALRAEYQAKMGKRPFNGWDAATLRGKIASAV